MEKKKNEKRKIIVIDVFKLHPDSTWISPEKLVPSLKGFPIDNSDLNSRCVPVGTKMNAPGGRNKKKMFKAKRVFVKFRCSVYEKKLLQVKAKRSGLTLSEYCQQVAAEKEIRERLSEDHLEIYKSLVKFHNNFKSIGNLFRKKNPKLSEAVYRIAEEIKHHL